MKTIEIWVAMDPEGNWGTGDDESSCIEHYREQWDIESALRVFRITLEVEPWNPIEIKGKIPASAGTEVVQLKVGGEVFDVKES